MRDEKGKFMKTHFEDNKIQQTPSNNVVNKNYSFIFPISLKYGVIFLIFVACGYLIWSNFLFLYTGKCALECKNCSLNNCYNYSNCLCGKCIDCLREDGFIMLL